MCGIAGIVSTVPFAGSAAAAIQCLQHRGPDGQHSWKNQENTVHLAHSRLSIIDRSEAAAQPMHYGGRYTIIHNGELYNYLELRAALEAKGYSFSTGTDTEVILASYIVHGETCLQQFEGMFAFGIWDEASQTLFAARDRFGEKPFFFVYDEEKLLFASEQKALWLLGTPKMVNRSMLYNFLTIGYTANPADPTETFFQGIKKLPAASFLRFDLNKNELSIEKYWQPVIDTDYSINEYQAIEIFRELFSTSIAKRLRSDVPVGTSLSGGLDSSAVVAFCEKQKSTNYSHKCFTVSFAGYEKDELKFAKLVAEKFGLQHHTTGLSAEEVPVLMQKVMHHQEEPFLSASVLAQYKIYELAKASGVTVLLDGQGADETLAGYHKYYKWYWQELYRNKKLKKSGEIQAAQRLDIAEGFGIMKKMAALFPEFATGILQSRKEKQAYKSADFDREFAFNNKRNSYYATPASFDLNGALYYNTFVNGLEELLRLADRNSMAHGTEVRLPFLDHKLVEFLFTLPASLKIHNGRTKWLLRKAVETELPPEITWRKDKVGLEPPQKKWMQHPQVVDAIQQGKRKLVEEKILEPKVLTQPVQPKAAHEAGSHDWRYWSASFLFS